jgi:glycosyltransferase involved in cell wall biosynthesis
MEALSCGIPVVASNRGSLPEMLTEAKICRLVEPVVEEFEKAIRSLTKLLAVQQRVLCRRYALKHFSDKNAEAILSAYRPS